MKCCITYYIYFAIDTVPNSEHLFSLIKSVIMFLLALLIFRESL